MGIAGLPGLGQRVEQVPLVRFFAACAQAHGQALPLEGDFVRTHERRQDEPRAGACDRVDDRLEVLGAERDKAFGPGDEA